jgi:hypothetical protein
MGEKIFVVCFEKYISWATCENRLVMKKRSNLDEITYFFNRDLILVQQLYNNPSNEGGLQYVGLTLM